MSLREYAIGLVVASPAFFIGSGVAHRFVSAGPALLIGAAVMAVCAFWFVRTLKSRA